MGHISSMIVHFIQTSGYTGVLCTMILESACIPIPSEVIMPFGGYLASADHLNLWTVIVLGTLGNVLGSLIAYYIGKFGGRAVILRYGTYIHVTERHLNAAEDWFNKRGEWAVLVARLLPGIRTFISLPAGIVKMSITRFILLTTLGSLPWVAGLAYGGYKLGQNWDSVKQFTHPLLYIVALLCVAVVAVIFYKKQRQTKKHGS